MNCTICHKPIALTPSAQERARKDVCGNTAAFYTSRFTEHADCQLAKRAADTSRLIETHYRRGADE